MAYCYKLLKTDGISDEKFKSAFYCSVESIKSILYDFDVQIEASIPSIFIPQMFDDKNATTPLSLAQCNDLLQGSFIDSNNNLYEEFKKIEPSEIKCT